MEITYILAFFNIISIFILSFAIFTFKGILTRLEKLETFGERLAKIEVKLEILPKLEVKLENLEKEISKIVLKSNNGNNQNIITDMMMAITKIPQNIIQESKKKSLGKKPTDQN